MNALPDLVLMGLQFTVLFMYMIHRLWGLPHYLRRKIEHALSEGATDGLSFEYKILHNTACYCPHHALEINSSARLNNNSDEALSNLFRSTGDALQKPCSVLLYGKSYARLLAPSVHHSIHHGSTPPGVSRALWGVLMTKWLSTSRCFDRCESNRIRQLISIAWIIYTFNLVDDLYIFAILLGLHWLGYDVWDERIARYYEPTWRDTVEQWNVLIQQHSHYKAEFEVFHTLLGSVAVVKLLPQHSTVV